MLIKKCNSYLFLLSRITVFYLEGTKYCFTTLILPHLDLCCIICGNCSSTLKDKLVKFQKRAARVIFDCDFIRHPQNYLKNSIGKYFQKDVSYTSNISCRDTRSTNCNQLFTPKLNCELFRKSFMYSGAAIWNSLPLHVKNATSVNTFICLYLKWKRLNDH